MEAEKALRSAATRIQFTFNTRIWSMTAPAGRPAGSGKKCQLTTGSFRTSQTCMESITWNHSTITDKITIRIIFIYTQIMIISQ